MFIISLRSCNVCEAVATPSPVPVNPQIPAGDILQAPLQRFNQPLLPGQQLNPALQLIALAQHMNALNAAQRIRLPPFDPRRYTEVSFSVSVTAVSRILHPFQRRVS